MESKAGNSRGSFETFEQAWGWVNSRKLTSNHTVRPMDPMEFVQFWTHSVETSPFEIHGHRGVGNFCCVPQKSADAAFLVSGPSRNEFESRDHFFGTHLGGDQT